MRLPSIAGLKERFDHPASTWVYGGLMGVLVCLPVLFSLKGGMFIGCDTILPFYSDGVKKFLWQWLDIHNGTYYAINYASQYFYYRCFELITDDVFLKSSLLLISINVLSVLGIYRLAKQLYDDASPAVYFLIAAFYLLSPMRYNAWVYLQIYALIPWFFYPIVKILKTGDVAWSDILIVNAVLFGASLDLPNPKYIFYLFVVLLASFSAAFLLKKIDRAFFARNYVRLILFFSVSTYLFVPVLYFGLHYDSGSYGDVAVRAGYTHDVSAQMMDFGTATAARMFRLFHDGLTFIPAARPGFLSNPLMLFSAYFFLALIVFYFIRNRKRTLFDTLLMGLTLMFLFFATGPNPPFGFIYQWFVTRFSVLAFLRTTAGAVFFLSLFYSLLLFLALRFFNSRPLNIAFGVCLLFVAYPQLNGKYYENWSPANPFISKGEYGMKVPQEYFSLKPAIDSKWLDARVFVPNSDLTYINTKWGFFGPSALYTYMYNAYFIGGKSIYADLSKHNVKYIFRDDSLIELSPVDLTAAIDRKCTLVAKEGFLRLDSLNNELFFPRIYSLPQHDGQSSSGHVNDPIPSRASGEPVIEYKRADPTRYRVVIHRILGDFTLVLSEQFHELWKVYVVDHEAGQGGLQNQSIDTDYKILANNEEEQATLAELKGFVNNGWITALGNGRVKKIIHRRYTPQRTSVSSVEELKIDFVSRKFRNTIQNNNLAGVGPFMTLFANALPAGHERASQHVNAWNIQTALVREKFGDKIVLNDDGSYDMELVLEFQPQRVFAVSVLVSLVSLLIVLILWARNRNGLRSTGVPSP